MRGDPETSESESESESDSGSDNDTDRGSNSPSTAENSGQDDGSTPFHKKRKKKKRRKKNKDGKKKKSGKNQATSSTSSTYPINHRMYCATIVIDVFHYHTLQLLCSHPQILIYRWVI